MIKRLQMSAFNLVIGLCLYALGTRASIVDISQSSWNSLNVSVEGRLVKGTPVSLPCFSKFDNVSIQPDPEACAAIQASYGSSAFRDSTFGAYMQPEFEACMKSGQGCLLDSSDPTDPAAFANATCFQGSVSTYYIDVRKASDVQAAFSFSRSFGIDISIKNSGHDYKGRSSSPDSLGLWVHNLNSITYNATFVPEGCSDSVLSNMGVTTGTGASWQAVYDFADANNITVLGGYEETVASSGGWLMGGGHSILSPVFGLGVDRVLQFRIVTPDGEERIANKCQNSDLFWALRGGGGGTFGVVLEATQRAEKQLALQVAVLSFNATMTSSSVPEFYKIIVENSLKWGKEGWGGHVETTNLIYVNPLLNLSDAQSSMKPLSDWILSQNGTVIVETVPSWNAFFTKFVPLFEAPVGIPQVVGSRLIPKANFETEEGRTAVYNLLLSILRFNFPYIPVVPPLLFDAPAGSTSVTPAWRNSLWHLIFPISWNFNSSIASVEETISLAHNVTELMRDIAPTSGSYFNEGDIYEVDHETSYWGPNYPRLLQIKEKYDPTHLLDCWQCVGWKGSSNGRYACYPPSPA